MAKIKNTEGFTIDSLNEELAKGGKFVVFKYCYSIVIMTFREPSEIYFIKANESTLKYSILYTLITLFFGWWGIPWGPIYTIGSLFTNLTGGEDVTNDVIDSMNRNEE